jgi:hypothetical protein
MHRERYNSKLFGGRRRRSFVAAKNVDTATSKPVPPGALRLGSAGASILTALLLTPSMANAGNLHSPWRNGPPQDPTFFPLAVWWQNPIAQGHTGPYSTLAQAVAATKMNIFLGLSSGAGNISYWPEYFGKDNGELEAIQANNLYVVGGINTPSTENTSPDSVASVLALASSIGADANVIGYNAGDEPNCSNGTMAEVPAVVAGIHGYDPTRVVTYNNTAWMLAPQYMQQPCLQQSFAALQATSIGSFDLYPLTSAWMAQTYQQYEAHSDFKSIPNDTLWVQGIATQALIHDGLPAQPAWVYIEAGGDNFGFSEQNNKFAGDVTDGSTTLVNASGWSSFTSTWVGLTVSGSGIPANTTITSIIDGQHAVMSAAATATSSNDTISVTDGSGPNADCVASANLCVVNGNEYRPTPPQVAAEVWMSIISGANGIEYFCHDLVSYSFCLGDTAGGPEATVTQQNLTYIDTVVDRFADRLNAPTAGICSMQQINFANGEVSTTTSCSNGMLTMATGDAAVPGLALVKRYNGHTYLFAQSDRRSPAGATFTYTLTGLSGHPAEVVYDSDGRYDPAHTSRKTLFTLNAQGQFADVLGANGDDYQVKVYRIQ